MRVLGFLTVLFLLASCSSGSDGRRQDHELFIAGVRNTWGTPTYLKIQTGQLTGPTKTNCVTGELLLNALHIEHNLPRTDAGFAAADRIAVLNRAHSFRFSKPEALTNMPDPPTEEELALASKLAGREAIANLKDSFEHGALLNFYTDSDRLTERKAALACSLIDLGYKPAERGFNGRIYIES